MTKAFQVFRSRNYRFFWLGCLVSNLGTWMQELAQPWLVLSISGSPFLLGLDGFASGAPSTLLLVFGGVLADRFDRRRLLFIGTLIQILCASTLFLLVVTHLVKVWHVICTSLLCGFAIALTGPAVHAFVPLLVDKKNLASAIALTSVQFNLCRVLGPVLGGIVMSSLGAAWCFGLNAISFAAFLGALAIIRLPHTGGTSETPVGAPLPSLKEGFLYISKHDEVFSLLLLLSSGSLFIGPLLPFLAVLIKDTFHASASTYSLALSLFGAGSLAAAMSVTVLQSKIRKISYVYSSCVVASLALIAICIAPNFYTCAPALFVAGFSFIFCYVTSNTIIQTTIPDHLRGRTMSLFVLTFRAFVPLGTLLTGSIVATIGFRKAFLINGTLLLATLLYLRTRYQPEWDVAVES